MIKTRFGIFDKDTGKKLTYKEIEKAYEIRGTKDIEWALTGRYNETLYIGREPELEENRSIKKFNEVMEEAKVKNVRIKVLEDAERVEIHTNK